MSTCSFCTRLVSLDKVHCPRCGEVTHLSITLSVVPFSFAVNKKFLDSFGTKAVGNWYFSFNPFPLRAFEALYSESGQVGQGCGQQTVLRAIKAKSQTATRSCILSTLEHLKITLPNSYFKKLSGGEVSFLIPPVTFKHFTVHGSPIEHLRIIYSVGFLNSNGIFTFPDQFFASQTNEFLNFVLCVIPIASQWQPQNREKSWDSTAILISSSKNSQQQFPANRVNALGRGGGGREQVPFSQHALGCETLPPSSRRGVPWRCAGATSSALHGYHPPSSGQMLLAAESCLCSACRTC